MSKREVLNLFRECVVEATDRHSWTVELPDGHFGSEHIDYIDANKMIAAIDALFEKMNDRAKGRRKRLTPASASPAS